MLDGLTLDQLRTFIAAAEEGSFSAAGRKLGRAQSVVSKTLANLEAQLGVKLFDRSARYPRLTDEGREFSVLSPQTWRLSDLGSKHAFLKAGFGWGYMPLPAVAEDIRDGRLVKLRIEGKPARAQVMPMHAVWRKDAPPGPAGRALVEWLTA